MIFKDATKIQNGRQRSTLKLKVRIFSKFTITFLTIWRYAGDFFKLLLKFEIAATDKLSQKLFKFYYHITHDMAMCRCFFKILLKFKIAAMDELHTFLWAQKLKN